MRQVTYLPTQPTLRYPTKVVMWNGVLDVVNHAKYLQTHFRNFGMVDYVRNPTPHDSFGGVAQRGLSGQICDLSEFFLFFFCFLQRAPRSHFLTDRHNLYANTRVSGQRCAFWGLDNIRLHLVGQIAKNILKMGGNRHFTAK